MPGVRPSQAFSRYPKDLKSEEWCAVNMTEELCLGYRHDDRIGQSNDCRRPGRFVVDEGKLGEDPSLLESMANPLNPPEIFAHRV